MNKDKKNYYNMNKQELVSSLEKYSRKKKNILSNFYFIVITSTVFLTLMFLPLLLISKDLLLLILNVLLDLTIIHGSAVIVTEYYINNKLFKIKKTLNDRIEMDYEKKRYELDKKYKKENTNNKISNKIKSNDEKIALLKEYKEQLENYGIKYPTKKLDKELNGYQYTKKILNKLDNHNN